MDDILIAPPSGDDDLVRIQEQSDEAGPRSRIRYSAGVYKLRPQGPGGLEIKHDYQIHEGAGRGVTEFRYEPTAPSGLGVDQNRRIISQ